jgi:hypothetical protein
LASSTGVARESGREALVPRPKAKEEGMGQAQSTGVTEAVASTASDVADSAKQQIVSVKDQASERARSVVDSRSTEVGSQLRTAGDAMGSAVERMRSQGAGPAAGVVETVADRVTQLGSYMESADADRLLRDVEELARRRPWLVAGAAATAGFVASRLLKVSSARRSTTGAGDPSRWRAPDGAQQRQLAGGGVGVAG